MLFFIIVMDPLKILKTVVFNGATSLVFLLNWFDIEKFWCWPNFVSLGAMLPGIKKDNLWAQLQQHDHEVITKKPKFRFLKLLHHNSNPQSCKNNSSNPGKITKHIMSQMITPSSSKRQDRTRDGRTFNWFYKHSLAEDSLLGLKLKILVYLDS